MSAPIVRFDDGVELTAADVLELYNAAISVVGNVSPSARRHTLAIIDGERVTSGTHCVSARALKRLAEAAKRKW